MKRRVQSRSHSLSMRQSQQNKEERCKIGRTFYCTNILREQNVKKQITVKSKSLALRFM